MLTQKWYPLAPHPKTRITAMRPSPSSGKQRQVPVSSSPAIASGILAIAAILLMFAAPALRAQADRQPTVAEQYLLAAANQDRASQGLPPLHLDPVLTRASALHAREMADHADISHQFDNEPDLADRGSNAGAHFSLISENVGEAPTSVIIHNLWMHSPGHRANLLDPEVDSVGIAIVTRDNQLYAVEDFARTTQTLTLAQQEHTVADVIAQSGLQIADTTGDARQTCTMSTGYAGPRRPWYIMRYTAASLNDIPTQLKTRLTSGKYHQAIVGACSAASKGPFTAYNIAVLLYP
jgi:uncharacterized protein YkwD